MRAREREKEREREQEQEREGKSGRQRGAWEREGRKNTPDPVGIFPDGTRLHIANGLGQFGAGRIRHVPHPDIVAVGVHLHLHLRPVAAHSAVGVVAGRQLALLRFLRHLRHVD